MTPSYLYKEIYMHKKNENLWYHCCLSKKLLCVDELKRNFVHRQRLTKNFTEMMMMREINNKRNCSFLLSFTKRHCDGIEYIFPPMMTINDNSS